MFVIFDLIFVESDSHSDSKPGGAPNRPYIFAEFIAWALERVCKTLVAVKKVLN